ncbi:uncharacterized protein AMSG_07010 [Thecamonas trahens ATCC 50062]|uniref:NOD3 protein n=1 Tax=Thecamonas trahens ATCC 50062 TaxID=461836 RepID=A0A0L0DFA7_THETB|nr:hypothetical protein AMSG_07010 [Thecamonas trahens ATCC 50062]KNC51032.1 hypothetical protein AMSG_07010 [Thecamonas trahens ATCC 50062]|eukprot:XP_013756499.1 hypothetical protein AMSG_07010 [Thecamonas trahens ATCC 50062]
MREMVAVQIALSMGDHFYQLRTVSLRNASLGPDEIAIAATALGEKSTLRVLDVSGNRLGDKGITTLCNALGNSSLQELACARNAISDAGMEALAHLLTSNPSLLWLDASHNLISDNGMIALYTAACSGTDLAGDSNAEAESDNDSERHLGADGSDSGAAAGSGDLELELSDTEPSPTLHKGKKKGKGKTKAKTKAKTAAPDAGQSSSLSSSGTFDEEQEETATTSSSGSSSSDSGSDSDSGSSLGSSTSSTSSDSDPDSASAPKGARAGDSTADVVALARKTKPKAPHGPLVHLLNLAHNRIGDRGAQALAQLIAHKRARRTIARLDLCGNAIGSIGAVALALHVAPNEHLLTLDISRNPMGADGAEAMLSLLESNHTLQELVLGALPVPVTEFCQRLERVATTARVTFPALTVVRGAYQPAQG